MMAGLLMVFMLFLTLILLDYRTMLEEKQSEIERLLGVKAQIIQALDREFSDSKLDIEIDPQTGAIRFKGGVFFELDSTEISNTGRLYLEEFIPKYMAIILSPSFRPYVAQIIVEGHTDQSGSYLYNLDLSQRRAFAVVREILDPDFPEFPEKQLLQTEITANGRSYSQPLQENGRIDWDRSRRVEFQFRLKDDELIQQVKDLLGKEQQ
ncbi:MAG TPA: OmpA family protein [Firmicutes bacterium]|nr:OmpA family protein [Candidatus Fermentithermobacillaceae bacterium]